MVVDSKYKVTEKGKTMQQWIEDLKADKDEAEFEEFLDDFEHLLKVYGSQDALSNVYELRREAGDIGRDWYVEFTASAQGEVGGAVVAYNLQADYVNLTIPVWLNETDEAVKDKTMVEAMEALSDLIDAKATKLRPYITMAEAAI